METKKINAYRAVVNDILDCYLPGGDLSKIPNLEGKNFNQGGKNNDCDYLPEQKYLHFFSTLDETERYALALVEEYGKSASVIGCHFDDELLKNCTFTGNYVVNPYEHRRELLKEYIIPLECYDPDVNFVKVLSKKTPRDAQKNYDPDGYLNGWF